MPLDQEEVVDIPGLNGEEIIIDLCEQIAQKLRRDCNLRSSDSYVNGYSAEVAVKIHCFGIDTAEVDSTIDAKKLPETVTDGKATETKMETEVTVAHEPDLIAVRERSEQQPPDVESKPTPAEKPAGETAAPQRRRYSGSASRVAGGGAQSADLSD